MTTWVAQSLNWITASRAGLVSPLFLFGPDQQMEIPMTVRAKFRCNEVKLNEHGAEVTLRPVVGNNPENARFYKATPGGQIQLSTINEQAAAQFKPGHDYYIDFTPADHHA